MTFTHNPVKSATRIESYNRCEAYYGYKYILKLPQPPNKYAEEGKLVHGELDKYYQTNGMYIPDNALAVALLRHLPAPGEHIESELEVRSHWEGHDWVAYIDLVEYAGDGIILRDHKTTGNLRYAKKKEREGGLYLDVQATVYTGLTFNETDYDVVNCNWNYVTRGKHQQTLSLHARIERGDNEWYEKSVLPVIQAADAINRISDNPDDWERKTSGCPQFGGCPYAGAPCVVKASKAVGASLNMGMSLKDKIAAKKASKGAPATPAAEPDQEVNPPKRGFGGGGKKFGASKGAGPSTAAPATVQQEVAKMPKGEPSDVRAALHTLADALADKMGW